MNSNGTPISFCFCLIFLSLITFDQAYAARISDIANTKHNLSASSTNNVRATTESRICAFCHTPHGADISVAGPLWNRQLSGATYTPYTSSSMEAATGLPTLAGSKLCLACHDGTLAIGTVNVLDGQANVNINMQGTGAGGVMPDGATGKTSGYTRNLGIDLTNDHPISFTYDTGLALNDGELRDPAAVAHIATRSSGVKPEVPLDSGKVECISCHDPHIRDSTGENIKFLRLNRFQTTNDPNGATYNKNNDIICLACHSKEGWVDSAHAHEQVANETYTAAAASVRDFPNALPVWRAACLNCHDSHTVQGARRLVREGTDSPASPKTGGSSAIEEACYQCHSLNAGNTITPATEVPDIKTDFSLTRRMPIKSTEQPAGTEVHDIGGAVGSGKDFIETQLKLGKGNLSNRHAECTDCHNPHRVTKNRFVTSNPATPDAAGTHNHAATHSNIASGVLRGAWGVEPTAYAGTEFTMIPTSFEVKKGVPPASGNLNPPVTESYVTREYQICLKCHSNYAFDDVSGIAGYNYAGRPALGSPGTPSGTNGVTIYTNQAMEFQAPAGHEGEGTSPTPTGVKTGTYACNVGRDNFTCNPTVNNHRGWHPVMKPTGRTTAVRGMNNANILVAPFNSGVGTQTMYCTDCHGSSTANGTVVPTGGENGNPWGPHGSTNNFILKGNWNAATGSGDNTTLCYKCHDYNSYSCDSGGGWGGGCGGTVFDSGFSKSGGGWGSDNNLHVYHNDRIGKMRCNWCHTAVPHGWKNKQLLVNVNDIGPEVGLPAGTIISDAGLPYNKGPYYLNAMNRIVTFAQSGNWDASNCAGRSWMKSSCGNPP